MRKVLVVFALCCLFGCKAAQSAIDKVKDAAPGAIKKACKDLGEDALDEVELPGDVEVPDDIIEKCQDALQPKSPGAADPVNVG